MPFDLNYSLIYSLKYFLLNIYKIWLQTDSYTNPYSKEFFFLLILKIYLFLFKDYGNVLFLLEVLLLILGLLENLMNSQRIFRFLVLLFSPVSHIYINPK